MEPQTPFWMDDLFLSTVLEEGKLSSPRVNIRDFSVRSAGSNFGSHPFRVWIEYEIGRPPVKNTAFIVVKIPNKRVLLSGNLQQIELFRKEAKVYREVLPKMNKKLNCEFGPKPLYSPVRNGTVLTDLREMGYSVRDEAKQLDVFHCTKTFETIAKFHAASVACHHDTKELIETVGEDVLWHEGGVLKPEMIKSAVKTVVEVLTELGGCEQFMNFLSSRVDSIWDSVVKITNRKERGLNVLNHGDLWSNNIMFKYDPYRRVEDVKLIDFQTLRYASPVLDLVNFIWTSADEDVRTNRQRELYQVYLLTLNATLERLGCEERLSEEEFLHDLTNAQDWAVVMICCAFPVIVSNAERVLVKFDLDDFDSRFKGIFYGEKLRNLLPNVVADFTEFFLQDKLIKL